MPRIPVADRIAAILDAAPVHAGWCPQSYSYEHLSREVYDVDEPTAPQLSAVRRAVAKLVAAGRADRAGRDITLAEGEHKRRIVGADGRESEVTYANPAPVAIRRPLTDAELVRQAKLKAASAEPAHYLPDVLEGADDDLREQVVLWCGQGRRVDELLEAGCSISPRFDGDKEALLKGLERVEETARKVKEVLA